MPYIDPCSEFADPSDTSDAALREDEHRRLNGQRDLDKLRNHDADEIYFLNGTLA